VGIDVRAYPAWVMMGVKEFVSEFDADVFCVKTNRVRVGIFNLL